MKPAIESTRDSFREARKKMGLTQTELAERLGMSLRAIQDIESGHGAYTRLVENAMMTLIMHHTIQHGPESML